MRAATETTGGVIWITGYSAAGKTTIGRQVNKLLTTDGLLAIFLDGDQLRSIFAQKWGYSKEDRIELACTYFRLCSHLSKQGAIVVISAVAMFDEARHWFKQNVDNGIEVYLRVPLAERIIRDVRTKGVYKDGMASMEAYTEPTNADVIIDNYGEIDAEAASRIVVDRFLQRSGAGSVDYGRSDHWANFYRQHAAVTSPSAFAEHCLAAIGPAQRLLEIGCGNGRDATYFADNGLLVTAIDKSAPAIEACRGSIAGRPINYICCDASDISTHVEGTFGVVYSRFSLHAMTQHEEESMLAAAFDLLTSGGMLCIECRSINDPLARKGDVLSPSERIDGHYRRFIIMDELVERLQSLGFLVRERVESAGLAIYKGEDPVVIRILATKG